jgi:hypothetical protein
MNNFAKEFFVSWNFQIYQVSKQDNEKKKREGSTLSNAFI